MSPRPISKRRRKRADLSVLTNRNFALLWLGEGLASLGIMTLRVTLVNMVYERTRSASGVSLLISTHIVAVIIITPIAGVMVDRFNRKKWMIGIGLLRALLVCSFVWTRSPVSIYLAYLALVTSSMLYTPALSAVIPGIVKKEQLLDANALNLSMSTITMILGPLLGVFIVAQFSLTATILLCCILYLLGPLVVFLVHIPPLEASRSLPPSTATTALRTVYNEFIEGARYVRGNLAVSSLIAILLLFQAGSSLGNSLSLPFAERVLHLTSTSMKDGTLSSAIAYGYMRSATSTGLLLGSLLVRYLGRRIAKKHLLLVSLGWSGLAALGMAVGRNLIATLIIQFIGGVGGGLRESLWATLLQENVEEDKLGRSFGLFMSTTSIFSAFTVYLGGWLADHTSIPLVFGLSGVCVLLTALGGYFLPGYRAIPIQVKTEITNKDHAQPTKVSNGNGT